MAKTDKHPKDMTNDELAHFVFPHEVVEHLKKIANPDEKPKTKRSSRNKDNI